MNKKDIRELADMRVKMSAQSGFYTARLVLDDYLRRKGVFKYIKEQNDKRRKDS